uniref:Solute carrier family 39 member 10 n=1 Tax=Scleropages formosus TaxID=113540 RepID=A0A8C9V0W7_SCLFO
MPESKKAMRVCLHSSICLLCVVTLLFHPYCPIHAHKNHAHSDHSHSHTPDGLQTSQVGGSSDPPTSNFGLDEALSEQRFYIQQLFRRYGQQDRLDFGGFQNLLLSLGLGQVHLGHKLTHGLKHDNSHDHSHDHNHRHKNNRSISDSTRKQSKPQQNERHRHPQHHKVQNGRESNIFQPLKPQNSSGQQKPEQHPSPCLNLTQLLHYYGLSPDTLISPTQFTYLCPALLYQIDSRVCIRHYHNVDIQHSALEPSHSGREPLAFFCDLVTILLSLLGVVLVPIINQSCFKFLLTFLVALAVGTLSGDALLHLLPHVSTVFTSVDLVTAFDGVWKGLTALAGIYLLFIIEHCIGMFKHYREQGCEPESTSHQAKIKKHGHSHGHSHCHSDQEMKDAGIASIAWMVIMGDGMHNFSDGLAIGAAFSANVTGGISTSVAVFCHELPHELGDFAVLLKAGMSVKQAIAYNLLSALMAYVGMLIGTAVGQYTYNVTSWIFAATAGMFLYVALVDMLPEMLHGDSEDHKRCQLGHFLLQNLGVLSGFAIMLLIAIFEEHIVLDLGF